MAQKAQNKLQSWWCSRGHSPKAQQFMFNSELSPVAQKDNQGWLQEGRGISSLCFPHSSGGVMGEG